MCERHSTGWHCYTSRSVCFYLTPEPLGQGAPACVCWTECVCVLEHVCVCGCVLSDYQVCDSSAGSDRVNSSVLHPQPLHLAQHTAPQNLPETDATSSSSCREASLSWLLFIWPKLGPGVAALAYHSVLHMLGLGLELGLGSGLKHFLWQAVRTTSWSQFSTG